jgi:hypothetical protein
MPPTSITSLMSAGVTPASLSAALHGATVRCRYGSTSCSNLARVSFMLRCCGTGRNVRQIDVGRDRRRELDLRLLGRLAKALQRELVLGEVDAVGLFELGEQVLMQHVVNVLAAEERVAVGGLDLEDAAGDLENRDVKRAAAQIVDGDELAVVLGLEAVRERRSRRLVDNAVHVEAGDLAGVLGRLALRVVEVGRHSDDGVVDGVAEMCLGGLFHLAESHGTDLRRRVLLALRLDPRVAVGRANHLVRQMLHALFSLLVVKLAANQTLHGMNSVLRIGHGLLLMERKKKKKREKPRHFFFFFFFFLRRVATKGQQRRQKAEQTRLMNLPDAWPQYQRGVRRRR